MSLADAFIARLLLGGIWNKGLTLDKIQIGLLYHESSSRHV